jgi:hypothetical protein
MTEILIVVIIIAVAVVAGIVIVWRDQMRLVSEAEWLNKNPPQPKPKLRKDIERQLYESDMVEIDPKEVQRISGQDLRIVIGNYLKRTGKAEPINWD